MYELASVFQRASLLGGTRMYVSILVLEHMKCNKLLYSVVVPTRIYEHSRWYYYVYLYTNLVVVPRTYV